MNSILKVKNLKKSYQDKIIFEKISFDLATLDDINIFFEWANEKETRENSFNNKEIFYDEHKNWYTSKINNEKNIFLVFSGCMNRPCAVNYVF